MREEIYTAFDPQRGARRAARERAELPRLVAGQPRGRAASALRGQSRAWSGDHCSNDPALVRGILFSNRKLAKNDPAMIDIAPTVLRALGVPVPVRWTGSPCSKLSFASRAAHGAAAQAFRISSPETTFFVSYPASGQVQTYRSGLKPSSAIVRH